ncbi:DUF317 domain-containing protein [Streptomyces sp. S1]|uniref:DUF317 domain-containing protein n=1 Tax=Streptomyces sp. S1 TaxID=718288 RepID=UPI000EF7BE5B|nr:DUF317 domain-containing protein [Streptomyces sp. S1]
MLHAPANAHIHFALHPDHHPGVIATTSGPTADAARSHLHDLGWRSTSPTTMVLARIDRDEPHYAGIAAEQLKRYGFTVDITPGLQDEINTEWEWSNYPFPWCTTEEVREVSAEAQRIHDDIADGRLVVHLHADDGHNTVAVASYTTGVRRHVHLHGENHVRQVTSTFESETEAIAEFHRLYSVAVRPGPAPLTDLERTVRQVLTGAAQADHRRTVAPTAEPPTAGPGEHESFLQALFDGLPQWERYRPFDETTIAVHESLVARAEFDHEARHRTDVAWTIAEYNGPVGERLWHTTITAGTPTLLIAAILQHLDAPPVWSGEGPHEILRAAGWYPASHPAHTSWTAKDRSITFEHAPHSTTDRWTVHGGDDLYRAAWTIRLSAGASEDLLAELASTAVALAPTPRATPPPTTALRLPAAAPQPRAYRR